MDAEYPAFEPPLCSELKHLCKRLQEAYRELKEDLTPFKDDRYYRAVLVGKGVRCQGLLLPTVSRCQERTLSGVVWPAT
ncbi:Hypothetical predicted protein [Marmota monax]|uniref:Uncharacterized protein n=1 Tax=Marmota monax TaxID=9995 RepID=A0A5E4CQF3_MARMO|nr:hypothetical protein GHT09_006230 [Marmota monax]VTJ84025.1 Hypothetical predicted protein [Marmota monax]